MNTNLKIVENGLIPIYEENSKTFADARELYDFIKSAQEFTAWIKNRIEKYEFIEGEDFLINLSKTSEGGRPRTEYLLTLDTAKEIAMVENNEQGRRIRKYFIEVEKRARHPKQMSQAELTAMIAQNQVEIERTANNALEIATKAHTRINNAINIFSAPIERDWKQEMNARVRGICQDNELSYLVFWGDLYKELEEVARVNLSSRQTNKRARDKKAGATYKECQAISKLDIIARDQQLKLIFEGIVRKYQAKYAEAI